MAGIGTRIKTKRESLGLTQEELANRLGYKSKSTINKIETGVNDIVQSKVCEFAKVLDTTIAYLMGWDDPEVQSESMTKRDRDINMLMEAAKESSDEEIMMVYDLLMAMKKRREEQNN